MKTQRMLVVTGFLLCISCAEEFHLPEGDPDAGREAFLRMGCNSCHEVAGEDFPGPVADPPVTVVLGRQVPRRSRLQLAESVLSPSHELAKFYKFVKDGDLSRMGSYDHNMTLKEWVDIVTYLDSLPGSQE
jgi:cytochrome c2